MFQKWLKWIIALILIILIVFGGYYYLKSEKTTTNNPPQSEVNEEWVKYEKSLNDYSQRLENTSDWYTATKIRQNYWDLPYPKKTDLSKVPNHISCKEQEVIDKSNKIFKEFAQQIIDDELELKNLKERWETFLWIWEKSKEDIFNEEERRIIENKIKTEKNRRNETPEPTSERQFKILIQKSKFIDKSADDYGADRDRYIIIRPALKTYTKLYEGDYSKKFIKEINLVRIWCYNPEPDISQKKYQQLWDLIGNKINSELILHIIGEPSQYRLEREGEFIILDIPYSGIGKIEAIGGTFDPLVKKISDLRMDISQRLEKYTASDFLAETKYNSFGQLRNSLDGNNRETLEAYWHGNWQEYLETIENDRDYKEVEYKLKEALIRLLAPRLVELHQDGKIGKEQILEYLNNYQGPAEYKYYNSPQKEDTLYGFDTKEKTFIDFVNNLA